MLENSRFCFSVWLPINGTFQELYNILRYRALIGSHTRNPFCKTTPDIYYSYQSSPSSSMMRLSILVVNRMKRGLYCSTIPCNLMVPKLHCS